MCHERQGFPCLVQINPDGAPRIASYIEVSRCSCVVSVPTCPLFTDRTYYSYCKLEIESRSPTSCALAEQGQYWRLEKIQHRQNINRLNSKLNSLPSLRFLRSWIPPGRHSRTIWHADYALWSRSCHQGCGVYQCRVSDALVASVNRTVSSLRRWSVREAANGSTSSAARLICRHRLQISWIAIYYPPQHRIWSTNRWTGQPDVLLKVFSTRLSISARV